MCRFVSVGVLALSLLLVGCGRKDQLPAYADDDGFRITPPPGWTERARAGATGAGFTAHRGQANLPLPPLTRPGDSGEERLVVRYDRLTAGRLAWLRVATAERPPSVSLELYLKGRPPRPDWQTGPDAEKLEVAGKPAMRIVFHGRWDEQNYVNETVGVDRGERTYIVSATFPAADETAREQVRKAIASMNWK